MSANNPLQIQLENFLYPVKFTNNKTIIVNFLTEVYANIYIRCNSTFDTYTFQEVMNLPMIISDKIYYFLTGHQKTLLNLTQFSGGIYDLFFSEFDEKFLQIFDILDFDNDNYINKDDAFLLLSHFHLIENSSKKIFYLENLIDNFFQEKNIISKEECMEMCENKNCDVIILMIIFINKYFDVIKDEELKQYENCINYAKLQYQFDNSPVNNNNFNNVNNNSKLDINNYIDYFECNNFNYKISDKLFEYIKEINFFNQENLKANKNKTESILTYRDNKTIENSDSVQNVSSDDELEDLNIFEDDITNCLNEIQKHNDITPIFLPQNAKTKKISEYFYNNSNISFNNSNINFNKNINNDYNENNNNNNNNINNSNNNNNNNNVIKKNEVKFNLVNNNNNNTNNTNIFSASFKEKYKRILSTKSDNANANTNTKYSSNQYETLISGNQKILLTKMTNYDNTYISSNNIIIDKEEIILLKSKNGIKTNILIKLILINSYIFYYKKSGNNFLFKKIIPIFSLFSKISQSNSFTHLNLISTIHNYEKTYSFFSENEEMVKKFHLVFNKHNKYRDINEDYKIKTELGKGKFGHVFLAEKIDDRNLFSIKSVIKNSRNSEEYKINRWESSIFTSLINIHHPNIIKCFKKYETEKNIYFVFEYVSGGDLKYFLKNNAYNKNVNNLNTIINISFQILKGIQCLHKYGIIHRDIKTTNMLVDKKEVLEKKSVLEEDDKEEYFVNKDNIKIIDFGLSRVLGKSEYSKDPYGSLCFKAPELIKHLPYDFKVDIWAIGITLYYFVYKELPYEKGNKQQIKQSIINDPIIFYTNDILNECVYIKNKFELPKKYENKSSLLYSLIKDCLEKNVEERLDINQLVDKYMYNL